ncbi:MAG TPA: class II aldolase/adducin family protein [Ramlibacter sp.]|jgi:ribulose-5-phosphate 4-epimerase/fuculose-1-phosphate aldolase|nr:class II aldolase/adducin family protein [Ramlibacter sp.]
MSNGKPVADLDKLARASRILELEGHGDLSLGHLSLRDAQGRGFWMKRNRIGLGEVLGADDFILVGFDGQKLEGEGGRHSEWPIHSEILLRRQDVQVVVHTHPLHASVLSASADALVPFTLDADYFDAVPRHVDEVALVTLPEEGRALAQTLGGHFAVLMANHGVTFCGTSVEHATCIGVFLEQAARAHVLGQGAGLRHSLPSQATRARRNAQIMSPVHVEHSWNYLCRKLAWFEERNGGPTVFKLR